MRDDESAFKSATKSVLVYALAITVTMALTLGAVALGWPYWAVLTVLVVFGIGTGVLSGLYLLKRL